MAALSADRTNFVTKGSGRVQSYEVAAGATIYKGALVMLVAGYLKPAADAAGGKVVGVALEAVDNSSGAAGDLSCKVESGIVVEVDASSITAAMRGTTMYVVDDQTVDDATGVNSIVAGELVEYGSATDGLIYIPPFGSGQ